MDYTEKSEIKEKKLFSEFPEISTQEWENLIIRNLKGADYEKKLIWKTNQGFNVKPYYRAEDLNNLQYLNSMPGEFPFIRGNKKDNNDWEVRHDIEIADVAGINKTALDVIKKGADAVGLNATQVTNREKMSLLLKDIDIEKTAIHFNYSNSFAHTADLFINEIKSIKADISKIQGSFNFDPIGAFVISGKFKNSHENCFNEVADLINKVSVELPAFKAITINGQLFHNAGGVVVQVLPYTLALANEYLAALTGKGLTVDDISSKMQFVFAISANYFMEIAKLRAARSLWANIVDQYNPKNEQSSQMKVHATSSVWNKTVFDPYVNMLRNTTEAMSAAIGGCDSMSIAPFDSAYTKPGEFSRRIAQNVQLILKEESYLNKIIDPSSGSYYIENLTDKIAKESWKLFQYIEENGGFIELFKTGYINKEIEKICSQRDKDIATRKTSILGTNKDPNHNENMLEKIQEEGEEEEADSNGLRIYRGAEEFEAIRLATEIYKKEEGKRPNVFLLPMGNPAMYKRRVAFITNFFGCAGYEIIVNNVFNSIDEGVEAATASTAELVVICSSDEEYENIVPGLCKGIKEKNNNISVIVAGYPKNIIENLKSAGVDDFIHIKSNVIETLNKYHQKLGII